MNNFTHIGDWVYVRYINNQVEVRVNDADSPTVVYFDFYTMRALQRWYASLFEDVDVDDPDND